MRAARQREARHRLAVSGARHAPLQASPRHRLCIRLMAGRVGLLIPFSGAVGRCGLFRCERGGKLVEVRP